MYDPRSNPTHCLDDIQRARETPRPSTGWPCTLSPDTAAIWSKPFLTCLDDAVRVYCRRCLQLRNLTEILQTKIRLLQKTIWLYGCNSVFFFFLWCLVFFNFLKHFFICKGFKQLIRNLHYFFSLIFFMNYLGGSKKSLHVKPMARMKMPYLHKASTWQHLWDIRNIYSRETNGSRLYSNLPILTE